MAAATENGTAAPPESLQKEPSKEPLPKEPLQKVQAKLEILHVYQHSNFFYWWVVFWNAVRCLPHSVGRSRFRFWAGANECGGWPAQRTGNRKVQSVSGHRGVGRYWTIRCLFGRLERHPLPVGTEPQTPVCLPAGVLSLSQNGLRRHRDP